MLIRFVHNPLVLLGVTFLVAVVAHRFANPARRPPPSIWLIRALRGVIFLLSGLSKLLPSFPNVIGPVQLEQALAPHGLALFARFVALSEALIGLFVLLPRVNTLGAVMLFPMLTSILVITVSLQWRGTPYVNAVLLALNAALLIYDYPKLAPMLRERPATGISSSSGRCAQQNEPTSDQRNPEAQR